MQLEKLSLGEFAAQLDEPFSMVDMASVGDLTASLYLCQGTLAWHRHLDQDELFWVHEGVTLLESERGDVRLRPGELAVVRKGLAHRSGSPLGSTVILIRCTVIPDRKNGRLRLYGTKENAPQRVNLHEAAKELSAPFQPQTVAQVEDAAVQVVRGEGLWPALEPPPHDILIVVLNGEITIHTDQGSLSLRPNELTVIPQATLCQLITSSETVMGLVGREE
ncbi:MAG: cupin domain-containing protein [Anaerolineae bacterium]|jgi:homogentisate 1,2-dioxygenase